MGSVNRADFAAGVLFILFGLGFGLSALDLEMGTPLRMGPGFFPMTLAVILSLWAAVVVTVPTATFPGQVDVVTAVLVGFPHPSYWNAVTTFAVAPDSKPPLKSSVRCGRTNSGVATPGANAGLLSKTVALYPK